MAVNRSIRIYVHAEVTDAEYQRLIAAVAAATRNAGPTTTATDTYVAGTGTKDNVSVTIA